MRVWESKWCPCIVREHNDEQECVRPGCDCPIHCDTDDALDGDNDA